MASGAQHQVVILYEHALLGEGIAKYLLAQLGVEATVAPTDELQAVMGACRKLGIRAGTCWRR